MVQRQKANKKLKKHKTWRGKHKEWMRRQKEREIRERQREGFISKRPGMCTFPGSCAHLEKSLVNFGVTEPEAIVGIQSYTYVGGERGKEYLDDLLRNRRNYLRGMYIWPHEFETFVKSYKGTTAQTLSCTTGKPGWYTNKRYLREMDRFATKEATPFEILDMDICGGFNQRIGEDISTLMENQKLADQGLLFITHSKGRDADEVTVLGFLRNYFCYSPYFDIGGISDPETGENLDLNGKSTFTLDTIRRILVPVYYVCQAFINGYKLEVDKLFEYRDGRKGTTMYQWFFRFEKLKGQKGGIVHKKEEKELLERLSLIRLGREGGYDFNDKHKD